MRTSIRKPVLFVIAIICAATLQAQKIKLIEGDIKPFKNEKSVNIAFSYDERMKVGQMTEASYIQIYKKGKQK